MATAYHYLLIGSPAPLMFCRVPVPRPPWRSVLKALTAVMQTHGCRQKDIYFIERHEPGATRDHLTGNEAALAYAGQPALRSFMLYDWTNDARFELVRGALPEEP